MTQLGEKYKSGGQGRVATQVHFYDRREPAQMEIPLLASEKRGLRLVILGGDALEEGIGQPLLQDTHPGWVASEELRGECINLVILNAHGVQ